MGNHGARGVAYCSPPGDAGVPVSGEEIRISETVAKGNGHLAAHHLLFITTVMIFRCHVPAQWAPAEEPFHRAVAGNPC